MQEHYLLPYSKKNVVTLLRAWGDAVADSGHFSDFGYKQEVRDLLGVVDQGIVEAARELASKIESIPTKVLRKDFKDIVVSVRDEYTTFPMNKYRFSNDTGYAQILGKSTDVAYAYGKFKFNTDIVFNLFSKYNF